MLSLAACGQRGVVTVDPVARNVGSVQEIFIGTTRAFDPEIGSFGSRRSPDLSLARLDVSVPPDRQLGEIRWPRKGRPADPRTDFVTAEQVIFSDGPEFRRDLSSALRRNGKPRVTLFVHGFNNTFAEGTYRIAQLSHDLAREGVIVHYSWPSLAQPLGYVHDRDSALYARDGLEKLIAEVVAAGAREVIVVGHSMGALLLVETLRQIDIRDPGRLNRVLDGVVLLSPDIDLDVFHAQAATFEQLPQPFLIFTSQRDRALRLSAIITGQPDRLGNLTDINEVGDLPVRLIDATAFSSGSGHFTIGDSPELIYLISQISSVQEAFSDDNSGRVGLLPGIVLTARSATAIVVKPIEVLSEELQ